jgi:hypothetical protein
MGAAALPALIGIQVGSSILQSEAQKNQANFQSEMMYKNSREAERMAARAMDLGEKEAKKYSQQINQFVGRQRAAYGASGVDVNFGTAQAVQKETRDVGYQDVENIRTNAFMTAMGYKSQAQDISRQARFAKKAGDFEANMTLLGGGLDAAKTYYKYTTIDDRG